MVKNFETAMRMTKCDRDTNQTTAVGKNGTSSVAQYSVAPFNV